MTCIWNKAKPCEKNNMPNVEGKGWKTATVNLRDSGCDYKGSVDLKLSCIRSNTSTPDLLWPNNKTLTHDLQWTVIGNGAAACFSGTPYTGTLRYISIFGFYGSRVGGRCARADPTSILQILGVLPADGGHELSPETVEQLQKAHNKGEL